MIRVSILRRKLLQQLWLKFSPKIPKDQSPSNVVAGALSDLAPQEEVADLNHVAEMNPLSLLVLPLKGMKEGNS